MKNTEDALKKKSKELEEAREKKCQRCYFCSYSVVFESTNQEVLALEQNKKLL